MDFVAQNWYLFVFLVLIIAMIAFEPLRRKSSGIQGVTPMQSLKIMQDDNVVILDVSESSDFKKSHLPEAINSPLSKLDDEIDKLAKRHAKKPVVVYCRMGNQSSKAIAKLKQKGFENLHELRGGINAWERDNLPTES